MSKTLELKRKQAEILRVISAKAELDLKKEEAIEQIARLEANILIQDEAIKRLEKELEDIKNRPESE
jgi:hypothetical protein